MCHRCFAIHKTSTRNSVHSSRNRLMVHCGNAISRRIVDLWAIRKNVKFFMLGGAGNENKNRTAFRIHNLCLGINGTGMRRFLIKFSIYAVYPFLHALLSWVFGVIFTKSPEAGLHIYGDVTFMIGLALYQLPFSLLFGGYIAIRYRAPRDYVGEAFVIGVGFSIASGVGASVLERHCVLSDFQFLTSIYDTVEVVAAYIFHYFIFGLALLLGGVLSVIAAGLVVQEAESEL